MPECLWTAGLSVTIICDRINPHHESFPLREGRNAGKRTPFFHHRRSLSAVCNAFAQYPSRFNLLSVIWPMVFGDGAYVLQDGGNRSVWAKIPGAAQTDPIQ
jgi:hypothetical protein